MLRNPRSSSIPATAKLYHILFYFNATWSTLINSVSFLNASQFTSCYLSANGWPMFLGGPVGSHRWFGSHRSLRGEICDLRNELYEGVRKYVYAYGLRWDSRLPPGLAGNPTRLSLASVGPTAPSTENSTLEGWRLLPKKLLPIRC